MWPYWLMFIFPAFAAIHNGRVEARQNPVGRFYHLNRRSIFVIIVLSLIIGFRHRVGGDALFIGCATGSVVIGFTIYATMRHCAIKRLRWCCLTETWVIN